MVTKNLILEILKLLDDSLDDENLNEELFEPSYRVATI